MGTSGPVIMGFSGGDGGTTSTQTISNFTYTNSAAPTIALANNLTLTGGTNSTVDMAGQTATLATLTVNNGSNTTLNVTGTTLAAGQAFSLTLGSATPGSVSLLGNVTFNVAASGTLNLGAVTDNGTRPHDHDRRRRRRDDGFAGHEPRSGHGFQRQWHVELQ